MPLVNNNGTVGECVVHVIRAEGPQELEERTQTFLDNHVVYDWKLTDFCDVLHTHHYTMIFFCAPEKENSQ